jgi:hypothetical protein
MGPTGDGRLPMSPWYGTETETRDHNSENPVENSKNLVSQKSCP